MKPGLRGRKAIVEDRKRNRPAGRFADPSECGHPDLSPTRTAGA